MAWLSGWDRRRIRFTIDSGKVDSTLTHFAVMIKLTSAHGAVFDELTADANRFKIAFTKADGTTELYAEIIKWNDASESAIIHISRSGWEISSSVDTYAYMYFDVNHADNTTYIGDIGSTPGASVWDSYYKAVLHMVDATTSTIKDSTSNNNDGTKKGANEPIETTGMIGRAQDFEPTDDEISIPNLTSITSYTVETIIYPHQVGTGSGERPFFSFENYPAEPREALVMKSAAALNNFDAWVDNIGDADAYTFTINTWAYVVAIRNGVSVDFYKDGVDLSKTLTVGSGTVDMENIRIGGHYYNADEQEWFDGVVNETRISNTNRSVAWIKATYSSLWNTLISASQLELGYELAEAFSNTDSLVKNGTEQLAEAFSVVDSWVVRINLAEAFSVVESWVVRINLAEAFSIADSLVKSAVKQLTEAFSIADSITKLKIFLSESLSVTDSFKRFFYNLYSKVSKAISTYTKINKDTSDYIKKRRDEGEE